MKSMRCPRCKTPLTRGTYAAVRVYRCDACSGIALQQRHILPVLEKLAIAAYEEVSLNVPPPIARDTTATLTCPNCQSGMERYGYMGSNQLMIDRCPDCTLIWLDKDELPTMVAMHVRLDRNLGIMRSSHEPADIVGTHMITQAVSMALLAGFILG